MKAKVLENYFRYLHLYYNCIEYCFAAFSSILTLNTKE